ncbi:hypothetical protein I7I50_08382 [Histoplasma capsulatum G186AR]|uniref:Uncharacterized protein n=1 Tax=Ajellomyces capsulatus TaxID=5037 RepID=A0A8H7YU24_AJECA|nr:hypothetical protein I7I52_05898 [Histoplasma capsulatum]QSS73569.1 hypothetical protein I7I50_08382 [Histoplasma capsulatum G186AR]
MQLLPHMSTPHTRCGLFGCIVGLNYSPSKSVCNGKPPKLLRSFKACLNVSYFDSACVLSHLLKQPLVLRGFEYQ